MKFEALPFGTVDWTTENPVEGYELSTDPARLDIAAMHAYLSRSYWSPGIPLEVVERAARNSLCFAVYEKAGGKQVGLTRVVTDHATFAYLCDVFVLEDWQGRGLGDWLIARVVAHPALQGLRRFSLFTKDAHALYARHGFQPLTAPDRGMERLRPDVYRAAP